MQYKIKENPEDFIVKELSDIEPLEEGEYTLFILKKRDCTTHHAVDEIARRYRVHPRSVGFAGIKDKKAVTYQYITVKGNHKSMSDKDMELTFLGYRKEPLHIGELVGNSFEIIVRRADNPPKIKTRIPNLFGEQRFSSKNILVGKLIIKKQFREAVEELSEYHEEMKENIQRNDYIGALKKVPFKILKLYVHAYQSHIWNLTRNSSEDSAIPLVGFGTELTGKTGDIILGILQEEGIKLSDFIIRQIPELSLEGEYRSADIDVKDLRIEDIGSGDYRLSFFLPKGSYATVVIDELFT